MSGVYFAVYDIYPKLTFKSNLAKFPSIIYISVAQSFCDFVQSTAVSYLFCAKFQNDLFNE